VVELLYLAEIYIDVDRARALEWFPVQAFSAESSLPADWHRDRCRYVMAQVATVTAGSNVDLASELLGQIDAPQSGRMDHRARRRFNFETAAELTKAAPEGDPLKACGTLTATTT